VETKTGAHAPERKVYLDNVIVCGEIRGDLAAPELVAVLLVQQAARDGKVVSVTSREAWREQDKTKNEVLRALFHAARGKVPVVEKDHRLLGFNHVQDQYGGFITSPMITDVVDEPLFAHLKKAGLKEADARHLMYATHNGCDVFLTTDPDFVGNRFELQKLCPGIRILKPSDFIQELMGAPPTP